MALAADGGANLVYFEQLLRRLRRECDSVSEKVGESGDKVEDSYSLDAVGALRVEVSAALSQMREIRKSSNTVADYESERRRLLEELGECEETVRRLESVAAADSAMNEVESLLNRGELASAGRKLSDVPRTLLKRRRRELCGSLEARAMDLASRAVQVHSNKISLKKRTADCDDVMPTVVYCLSTIDAADRFFDHLANEMEPVLLKAKSLKSRIDSRSAALEAGEDDEAATLVPTWLTFLREGFGFDDQNIRGLHSRMLRWPREPLERAVRDGRLDAETIDVKPLDISLAQLSHDALQASAADALTKARSIVLGDWHNDSEVDCRAVLSAHLVENENAQKEQKKGLRVSLLVQDYVAHAESILEKALDAPPNAAKHLYLNVRRAFELYTALFPLVHADTIHAQRRMKELFQNDILFLIKTANRFSIHYCPKLNQKQPGSFFTFVDQLTPLRDLANDLCGGGL